MKRRSKQEEPPRPPGCLHRRGNLRITSMVDTTWSVEGGQVTERLESPWRWKQIRFECDHCGGRFSYLPEDLPAWLKIYLEQRDIKLKETRTEQ